MAGSEASDVIEPQTSDPSPLVLATETLWREPAHLPTLEPMKAVVLLVERYLSDLDLLDDEGLLHDGRRGRNAAYVYDLTLWDGSAAAKCFLGVSMNTLVHKNRLHAGSRLLVRRFALGSNDKRIDVGRFLVLRDVRVTLGEDYPRLPGKSRERFPWAGGREPSPEPLFSHRQCYLSLWCAEDHYGDRWQDVTSAEVVPLKVPRRILLAQLEVQHRGLARNFPPLVVRVINRSRLRHYGRPEKQNSWPFQVYLEVADSSARASVVLWNSFCAEWFRSFEPGCTLLLSEYTVKPSYLCRTRPAPYALRVLPLCMDIDIGLDAHNPSSIVRIIDPSLGNWNLPSLQYNFIRRASLTALQVDYTCDVAGLVTFVGRPERIRKKDDPEEFWVYRWVWAKDGSSNEPFILQIFSTSQPDVHACLKPMTILVCTQMRVSRSHHGGSFIAPYLTTSNESQVFVSGFHRDKVYRHEQVMKELTTWTSTLDEEDLIAECRVGGYYTYPPLPPTLSQFQITHSAGLVLTSTKVLGDVLASLHYREQRRVVVQATIAAILYCSNLEEHQDMEPVSEVVSASFNSSDQPGPSVCRDTSNQVEERSQTDNRRCHPAHGKSQQRNENAFPGAAKGSPSSRRHPLHLYNLRQRKQKESCRGTRLNKTSTSHTRSSSHKANDAASSRLSSPSSSVPLPFVTVTDHGPLVEVVTRQPSWRDMSLTTAQVDIRLPIKASWASALPFGFSPQNADVLTSLNGLHPSSWERLAANSMQGPSLPRRAEPTDGYIFSLFGLSQKIVLEALFPSCVCCDVHSTRSDGPPNPVTRALAYGSGLCSITNSEVIQSTAQLKGCHLVCVLELYCPGADNVEVVLNRAYPVTEKSNSDSATEPSTSSPFPGSTSVV
uniref:RPA-related protein RADX isoform X2 n=1 Tax=Myxine glutinosa TaxID=7769 RepID=UPI00358ED71B